jgi:hypothetical protein
LLCEEAHVGSACRGAKNRARLPQSGRVMGNANIRKLYSSISSEDQRTLDRWVRANAVIGLIFAALIGGMAMAGWMAVGPPETAVANGRQPVSAVEAIPVVGSE